MKYQRHKKPVAAGSALRNALSGLGLQAALSRHNVIQLWPKIVEALCRPRASENSLAPHMRWLTFPSDERISITKNCSWKDNLLPVLPQSRTFVSSAFLGRCKRLNLVALRPHPLTKMENSSGAELSGRTPKRFCSGPRKDRQLKCRRVDPKAP
jgi:hypothetical protein